jgi:hypothetical protein
VSKDGADPRPGSGESVNLQERIAHARKVFQDTYELTKFEDGLSEEIEEARQTLATEVVEEFGDTVDVVMVVMDLILGHFAKYYPDPSKIPPLTNLALRGLVEYGVAIAMLQPASDDSELEAWKREVGLA